MDDREQKQRELAYKLWEDEGRVEGGHLDHWQRAGEQFHETENADVTDVNEKISAKFTKNDGDSPSAVEARPASVSSPD